MARGDKGTYNQQQQAAYGQASGVAKAGAGQSAAAFDPALAGYQGELANPGYTPAEQQAMTQATAGSLAGAFGAARNEATDAAGRTGNWAGYGSTEEELAQEQARENAQAMGGLQQAFGQARIQGEQNALGGLSSLYGQANRETASGLGAESSLVGTQGRVATQPSFLDRLLGSVRGGINLGLGGGKGK